MHRIRYIPARIEKECVFVRLYVLSAFPGAPLEERNLPGRNGWHVAGDARCLLIPGFPVRCSDKPWILSGGCCHFPASGSSAVYVRQRWYSSAHRLSSGYRRHRRMYCFDGRLGTFHQFTQFLAYTLQLCFTFRSKWIEIIVYMLFAGLTDTFQTV